MGWKLLGLVSSYTEAVDLSTHLSLTSLLGSNYLGWLSFMMTYVGGCLEGFSIQVNLSTYLILKIVCRARIAAANARQAYETKVLDPH